MQLTGVAVLLAVTGLAQDSSVVSIPYQLTYNLPPGFKNNLEYTFENGTSTDNSTINDLLRQASQSAFVSYDPEFNDIVGPDPQLELIETRPNTVFAYESGVWIPDTNQVWFTSASAEVAAGAPAFASVLNLDNNEITRLNTDPPIINPNGAYYYNGTVTFASYRTNGTYQGGIINVDPQTLKATTIVNSYFGLNFGGPGKFHLLDCESLDRAEVWLVTQTFCACLGRTSLSTSVACFASDPSRFVRLL